MTDTEKTIVSSDKEFWSLPPNVTYLNHGSFGPSPAPVRSAQADWTARLEQQPMQFFCRDMEDELDHAEHKLAAWLGTSANRIATTRNATTAMNIVAASIDLQPGDEVLLTDHEYGAVRNIWSEKCRQAGATIATLPVSLPVSSESVVSSLEARITDQTRLIVISHVTSATAATMPVQQVCKVARNRSIPVCVDGPHAIAMIDLKLDELGCDFYCASGHKWLCAPFGSGFLWVHPRHHARVKSPVVSWGGSLSGRRRSWKDSLRWEGTDDPAPLLSIATAVDFLDRERLRRFRQYARELLIQATGTLANIEGIRIPEGDDQSQVVSMCIVELPCPEDWQPGYHGRADELQIELWKRFGIEIPVFSWSGRRLLRLSAHLYNTPADFEHLAASLQKSNRLYG